jgi:zinc transport system permease protein
MDLLAGFIPDAAIERALVAGLAAGAACGLIGVFAVQRGLAFLSEGLAHSAVGGIGIGIVLGASGDEAIWIALPFTACVALAIGFVHRNSGLRADATIGVLFSVSFAFGALLLGMREPSAPPVDVEAILFGSLMSISDGALTVMLAVAMGCFAAVALLWSRLAYASFDAELAALSGVPIAALEYGFLTLTATAVVISVKTVGIVLVSAFVVIPAATARLGRANLSQLTRRALALQAVATTAGVWVAFHWSTPPGPTIVLMLGVVFAGALALQRARDDTR